MGEIALQRNTGEWGTIGCLLNANNGDKYICTNMHVLRKNNKQTEFFRPKEEQNQVDVFLKDIESGASIDAFFERGTMNGTDLAIARIQNNQQINFKNIIVGNGIPTGFLEGNIVDFLNLAINIRGAKSLENISGRIIGQTSFPSENIFNLLQAEIFSQNGDSGSPIFDDSLNLLGILVGGEINNHNISYIIPINQILDFINNDENIKNLNLSIQINRS